MGPHQLKASMSMETKRLLSNPAALHPAPGFSHAAVVPAGRVAYVSGQLALAADFSVIAPGDLAGQTRAAMVNVGIVLEELGASWERVVRRTIYTLQPTEFATITSAIEDVTKNSEHPAQTIVGITGLAIEGLLIEIEVTVALD